MKKHLIFLSLLFLSRLGIAQELFTLSGTIKDAATGEPLIGATIQLPGLSLGATTDMEGVFSIRLKEGQHKVVISYIGYVSQQQTLVVESNVKKDFLLAAVEVQMQEILVTAKKADDNVQGMEMSAVNLEMKTIKAMPAFMGEVDVIRSIQAVPGVSTVGEGATGFNVRGGSIDQNLVLLNDAPIYNSSHLMGFFSVFNPDAVQEVKLLKGGIPSQYGGRLSSLLDVRMKEGNKEKLAVSGGIGTVSSRLSVEAPIVKNKSSFILAGRRTYGDMFLKLSNDQKLKGNQLYFYDLSTTVNYTVNGNNSLELAGYFGQDVFRFRDDLAMNWGNTTGSLRWNHLFNAKLFSNFTLLGSRYNYSFEIPKGSQAFEMKSQIINSGAKADFNCLVRPESTVNFGIGSMLYQFQPGSFLPLDPESIMNPLELDEQLALEHSAYIDHEHKINEKLSLQYGVRFSAFDYRTESTVFDFKGEDGKRKSAVNPRTNGKGESVAFYSNLEPRFSARYAVTESSSLKLSYNRMAQYVHLITNTTASSPQDVWTPSTNNIKPEIGDQLALGLFRNFKDNAYETSVEAYYKTMSNQIDYVDGANLQANPMLEADLLYGKGRSYGVEVYAKKNKGKLNGWLSYTLSKTERQVNGLNNNKWYSAKYDKTHNLTLMGIYELSSRWSLSGNCIYSTGVAITVPNGRFEQDGIIVPINTDNSRNNYRLPAYHRFDLSATFKGRKRPGQKFESDWVFSFYNLYANRNPYTVYFRQNEEDPQKTEAIRLSVFGSIIPSITYNFKF